MAPGSSIELARHYREYHALAGLCIGSHGPVESIVLISRVPLDELNHRVVALPTASASSRCLLRILLELRSGIRPSWTDFDQTGPDPLDTVPISGDRSVGADEARPDAALFIGDIALRRSGLEREFRYDLGEEWTRWTGLPFVYALWMVRSEVADTTETRELHRRFLECRDALPGGFGDLAERASPRYRIPRDRLIAYWSRIRYELDEPMLRGLEHFLQLAAELGEAPNAPHLAFTSAPPT